MSMPNEITHPATLVKVIYLRCLTLGRGCGEALGERLASDLIGKPEVGAMAGFAWFMAMAARVSASSLGCGN